MFARILTAVAVIFCSSGFAAGAPPVESDYYRITPLPIPEGVVLEPGGLEMMPDGKLAVSTRRGEIWMVENPLAAHVEKMKFRRFAHGLHEVLGLADRDGWLYATQRGELTRMKDADGDGRADVFETVCADWDISGDYHEYAFGSKFDRDGNVWVVLCLTGSFSSNVPYRGWCVRVTPEGKMIPTCSGLRSPGGVGFNATGDAFYTDNQGPWNGTCSLKWLRPGSFQGHPAGNRWYELPLVERYMGQRPKDPESGSRFMTEAKKMPQYEPPAILFPYGKMGQSASAIACDTTGGRFGPFRGQLFVGDQTHSTVMRCFLEKVNGRYQGACFPFLQGFGSGSLALLIEESGALFVGGTSRGWGSRGNKAFALERVNWTGEVPFEVHEMRARADGFELTFTRPVDSKTAGDPASYRLETYTYIFQSSYGSPEVDHTTPKITGITVGADNRSVRLEIDGLQPGHVHELHTDGLRSQDGLPLLHKMAYYTLNHVPEADGGAAGATRSHAPRGDVTPSGNERPDAPRPVRDAERREVRARAERGHGSSVFELRRIDTNVLTRAPARADQPELRRMLAEHVRRRRREANLADVRTWRSIRTREEWEKFRDERIAALKRSLGRFPPPPKDLKVRVARTLKGDGYRIENVVFESRPGLLVTANLYSPARPAESMPGILICHSHHNPKTQGELQDMGVNWSRLGCCVLVMDQIGHGERRQHPFASADDYPGPFRVGRQDYYFRYNVGIQLHLVGESLIGWMAWDLMRGVDLLLSRPGVDPRRIILLGAVAGGGDPAAVAAALDERVGCVVPFNFGGPQPENVYPLPDDAEAAFNYVGGGSWESTRNLRLSARDGFLPWVIVGAAAPRPLIYAHEFSWDRKRDPVWKRLQKIYGFYDAEEMLASLHGYGGVTMSSNVASHCNNIGAHHREQIYPAFDRWFHMPIPESEHRDRRDRSELMCIEGVPAAKDLRLTPVHKLADALAAERIGRFRRRLTAMRDDGKRSELRKAWASILGDVEPAPPRKVGATTDNAEAKTTEISDCGEARPFRKSRASGDSQVLVRRFACGVEGSRHAPRAVRDSLAGRPKLIRTIPGSGGLHAELACYSVEEGILVPVLVLLPAQKGPRPLVVAFSQSGKAALLKERAAQFAALLKAGLAVCLPDLRGCGETSPGAQRGRRSAATGLSSSELMLGGTHVGQRLKDLRTVIARLRSRPEIDAKRIAVWGDSLAEFNPPGRRLEVPLGTDDVPPHSEPLGHLLALLCGVFEDDLAAVVSVRGGLAGFRSILQSPFVYVPHDAVVPGALTAGDLADLAAACVPRPLWIGPMADGQNRRVDQPQASDEYAPARRSYRSAGAAEHFVFSQDATPSEAARWLIERLQKR